MTLAAAVALRAHRAALADVCKKQASVLYEESKKQKQKTRKKQRKKIKDRHATLLSTKLLVGRSVA